MLSSYASNHIKFEQATNLNIMMIKRENQTNLNATRQINRTKHHHKKGFLMARYANEIVCEKVYSYRLPFAQRMHAWPILPRKRQTNHPSLHYSTWLYQYHIFTKSYKKKRFIESTQFDHRCCSFRHTKSKCYEQAIVRTMRTWKIENKMIYLRVSLRL